MKRGFFLPAACAALLACPPARAADAGSRTPYRLELVVVTRRRLPAVRNRRA